VVLKKAERLTNCCYQMFNFYIAKASASFGVTATRDIYEKAIEVLPDKDARTMCLKYADLETKLGEIDRARGVYGHAAQFADPRVSTTHKNFHSVGNVHTQTYSCSRLNPSGKSGMTLKSSMVTKTLSRRCYESSAPSVTLFMPITPCLLKSRPLELFQSIHSNFDD
jgi:hypothetical protein